METFRAGFWGEAVQSVTPRLTSQIPGCLGYIGDLSRDLYIDSDYPSIECSKNSYRLNQNT